MPHSRKYDLFALVLLACAAPSVSAQEVPLDAGAVKAAVLAETNAYRASKNIPQLKENAALEAAATASAVYPFASLNRCWQKNSPARPWTGGRIRPVKALGGLLFWAVELLWS